MSLPRLRHGVLAILHGMALAFRCAAFGLASAVIDTLLQGLYKTIHNVNIGSVVLPSSASP
jgi:hypothetical protein